MTERPQPLTPADCDLQDFKFMPLDVARLRDSDMASEQTPEENWAAVLLWAAAWHQVPAASVPDSENWLAKAAGYMSRGRIDERWKEIRDGAMRGFVLCSDGRWYHQVVAEKANESWVGKLKQRLKTECARIKKHNDRHGTAVPFPEFDAWFAMGCPSGQPLPVPRDSTSLSQGTGATPDGDMPLFAQGCPSIVPIETASKGQGEGQGQRQLTSKAIVDSSVPDQRKAPENARETMPSERNVQIALLLRAQGVLATAQNPIVAVTFASDPRVTDDVLNVAIAKARAAKPGEQIPIKYLLRVVETDLAELAKPATSIPAPQKGEPGHWSQSAKGIEAMGASLGMQQRPVELIRDYGARVQREIDQRKGAAP